MIVALKLAKAGYGTPAEIMEMQADVVIAATEYEGFLVRYEAEFQRLNAPTGKSK